jgi:hypothetical protein
MGKTLRYRRRRRRHHHHHHHHHLTVVVVLFIFKLMEELASYCDLFCFPWLLDCNLWCRFLRH